MKTPLTEFSPEMTRAIAHAKKHGNKLKRLPGGFWIGGEGGISFGTTTIQALVVRGAATYTDHKVGLGGGFPIEITLTPAQ